MTYCFHSSGYSSLFQIKLISLWISERIFLPPALINSAGILSVPGVLHLFSFSIVFSTSKVLGSGISGSPMCFCLPNITNPMYLEQLREMVPPPSQHTVRVCNQITLLFLYCVSSRLVTLLKVIDAPVQDSGIF